MTIWKIACTCHFVMCKETTNVWSLALKFWISMWWFIKYISTVNIYIILLKINKENGHMPTISFFSFLSE